MIVFKKQLKAAFATFLHAVFEVCEGSILGKEDNYLKKDQLVLQHGSAIESSEPAFTVSKQYRQTSTTDTINTRQSHIPSSI